MDIRSRQCFFRLTAQVLVATCLAAMVIADPLSHDLSKANAQMREVLPGYQLARCMFPEGRLVLEHEGRFVVLRKGDVLPGRPGLRVFDINPREAVLMEGAEGRTDAAKGSLPAIPERILKITVGPEGVITVIELSAQVPQHLVPPAPRSPEPATKDVSGGLWGTEGFSAGPKNAPDSAGEQGEEP